MKKLLLFVLFISVIDAFSQTLTMRQRTDTCATGAKGGVTSWKPCLMRSIGRSYTFSSVAVVCTADVRLAFTWRDTAATAADTSAGTWAQGGGIIPYLSGVTFPITVPNVSVTADTVWIKGAAGTIVKMWKF